MTSKILNRCDFSIKSDSKFPVINIIENKAFFKKMCENFKIYFEKIIIRIFVFVIFSFLLSKMKIMICFSNFFTKKKSCFRRNILSIIFTKLSFIRNMIQKKLSFKRLFYIINLTKR